jgi:hypothetical protein
MLNPFDVSLFEWFGQQTNLRLVGRDLRVLAQVAPRSSLGYEVIPVCSHENSPRGQSRTHQGD